MGSKCYAVQCIVNWEENPKNCPFPLRLRHPVKGGPSHGNRQHHVRGSGNMLDDRQTHTDIRTQYNTSPPLPWAK